jgi:hypothetical protein
MSDQINVGAARPLSSIPPQLPDQLSPFLTLLNTPVTLPVCRDCQAALLPKSVLDHLRKHHNLPVELRRAVRSLVATLPPLDFDNVSCNPDGSEPVEALRVVDAFQCKHCPFIRRDVTDMRKHINQEHQMSAASGCVPIQAQSWFGGRRAVYWRVCVAPTGMREGGDHAIEDSIVDSMKDVMNVDTLSCRWGFFGKGWGHRHPVNGGVAELPQ